MPNVGRRDGSLLFRTELCPHALPHTPRASCTPPDILADAVCCLRRDMSGSATRPFGCLCHEAVGFANAGPANLPPSLESYNSKRAFDAPLRHRGLPRESGACYAVAPALAAAGLPPASSVQLEPRLVETSPRFVRTYHGGNCSPLDGWHALNTVKGVVVRHSRPSLRSGRA